MLKQLSIKKEKFNSRSKWIIFLFLFCFIFFIQFPLTIAAKKNQKPQKKATPVIKPLTKAAKVVPTKLPAKSSSKPSTKPSPIVSPVPAEIIEQEEEEPGVELTYKGYGSVVQTAETAKSNFKINWNLENLIAISTAPSPSPNSSPSPAPVQVKASVKELKLKTKISKKSSKNKKINLKKWAEYETVIEGKLEAKDWLITIPSGAGASSSKPDATGAFKITIPISSERTNVTVQFVGPRGEFEVRSLELVFPYFGKKIPTRWSANIGSGFSLLNYAQVGFSDFSELAITVKGGINYQIIPGIWDTGVSAFYTLLPLTASGIEETNLRFFGFNARGGYRFELKNFPTLKFGLHGGVYYSQSFSNNPEFGYTGVSGPQFFPTLAMPIGKYLASTYFKFSPVGGGIWILDLDNREVAWGAGISIPLKKKKNISISIDISNLSIRVDDLILSSKSYTLGFGFGF